MVSLWVLSVLLVPIPMDPDVVPILVVAKLVQSLLAKEVAIVVALVVGVPIPPLPFQHHLPHLMLTLLVVTLVLSVSVANVLPTTVCTLVSSQHLPDPAHKSMELVACHAMKP